MRLLVDANLSHLLAERLRASGHDAVHVRDRGLSKASDDAIFAHALAEDRVILTEDTDFGALLAHRRSAKPSLVLLRSAAPLTVDQQADLLLANLDTVAEALRAGAVVTFARGRLRVRPLPL